MKYSILLIAMLTLSIGYGQNAYSIIYEADKDGHKIQGDLETLLEYVQNGNPVRVGWVLQFRLPDSKEPIEMQHWADAGFITTLNGHVFAQIRGIFQQGPNLGKPPEILLVTDKPNSWVAVIGTTGIMRQKFDSSDMIKALKDNGLTEEKLAKYLKDQEARKVITKWAVIKN